MRAQELLFLARPPRLGALHPVAPSLAALPHQRKLAIPSQLGLQHMAPAARWPAPQAIPARLPPLPAKPPLHGPPHPAAPFATVAFLWPALATPLVAAAPHLAPRSL